MSSFISEALYPEDVDEEEREFIIKTIIRDLYELHDNGDLHFNFSDEIKKEDWDYTRRLGYEESKKILEDDILVNNLKEKLIINSQISFDNKNIVFDREWFFENIEKNFNYKNTAK